MRDGQRHSRSRASTMIAPRVSEVRIDEAKYHTFSGVPISGGPRRRTVHCLWAVLRCVNQHANPFDVLMSGHQTRVVEKLRGHF